MLPAGRPECPVSCILYLACSFGFKHPETESTLACNWFLLFLFCIIARTQNIGFRAFIFLAAPMNIYS